MDRQDGKYKKRKTRKEHQERKDNEKKQVWKDKK